MPPFSSRLTLWLLVRLLKLERRLGRARFLHPFLAGFYPILGLYSLNADQLWPGMLVRPMLAAGTATVLLLAAAKGLTGRWDKAALMASAAWALFFGLGYADDALGLFGLNRPNVLRAAVPLLAAGGLAAAWRWIKDRKDVRDPTLLANIVAIALILLPLARIGLQAESRRWRASEKTGEAPLKGGGAGPHRDVYYIILDAYARGDVLRQLFGYDNGPFLRALQARGFLVLPESRSNYAFTTLSVASSLNMEYLDGVAAREGKDSVNFEAPIAMIRNSRVQRFLKERGYKTIHLKSGWAIDDNNPLADVQIGGGELVEFQSILLRASAAGVFLGKHLENGYRDLILNNLDALGQVARRPGPKYVFAHFVCPHEPYVFDRKGGYPAEDYGKATYKDRWSKKTRYVDQLHFISVRILEAIDRIRAGSAVPPIIVLQSDHGSASLGFWRPPPPAVARERMSNLCALALPGFRGEVPPDITNVNTFRFILDAYFDAGLGLLENRCYYSFYTRPYDWTDVTGVFAKAPSFKNFKPSPEEIRAARVDKGQ